MTTEPVHPIEDLRTLGLLWALNRHVLQPEEGTVHVPLANVRTWRQVWD